MRRAVASLCSALVLTALPSAAQETTTEAPAAAVVESSAKQNVIYGAPLSLVFGTIGWEYERAIGEKSSMAFGAPVTLPFGLTGALSGATNTSIFGLGGMVAYRHYFTGTALNGLFAGPELNVGFASVSSGTASATSVSFGVTGMVGYSFLTDAGFALSGGLGVSVGSAGASASAGGESGSAASVFVAPALRLNVGYAF